MNDATAPKRKPPTRKATGGQAAAKKLAEPEAPTTATTLAGKLAEAQLAIGHVPRSGHAVVALQGGGRYEYDYPTENDLMNAVRGELGKRGVAVVVSWDKVESAGTLSTVYGTLMFTDGTDQYSLGMIGTGADKGDKGIYKAMTGAIRYALWKTFLIPTGDEPDSDHQEVEKVQPAKAAKPATDKLSVGHRQTIQALLKKIDAAEGQKPGSSEKAWGARACDHYKVERWTDIPAGNGDGIILALGRRLHESETAAAEKAAEAVKTPDKAGAKETPSPGAAGAEEAAGDAAGGDPPLPADEKTPGNKDEPFTPPAGAATNDDDVPFY